MFNWRVQKLHCFSVKVALDKIQSEIWFSADYQESNNPRQCNINNIIAHLGLFAFILYNVNPIKLTISDNLSLELNNIRMKRQ